MDSLARFYKSQGENVESEKLDSEAMEISGQHLANQDSESLTNMKNLAKVIELQERNEDPINAKSESLLSDR